MSISKTRGELKSRVARGLNFGLEALEEVVDPDTTVFNDLILLKSKYNDLLHLSSLNTLPYAELALGLDKLRNALLLLIDRLEEKDLKKTQVEKEPENRSTPVVRSNFFQLLQIYRENLEEIQYIEAYYGQGNTPEPSQSFTGRAAIARFYKDLKRTALRAKALDRQAVRDHFHHFFERDQGVFEVYFQSIRHLLGYIEQMEVDRPFYLDTFQSLLSRYERAILFYYVLMGYDPELSRLTQKFELFSVHLHPTLVRPEHSAWLETG